MKEYINRLAKGDFVYDNPELIVSSKSIEQDIISESEEEHRFTVSAGNYVKGLVYSSNPRVVLKCNSFGGRDNAIAYTVNTKGLNLQESITGNFNIVSSAGEAQVSYAFMVTGKSCMTSAGEVRNMFHFANLVQTAPKEAETLFESEKFADIFIGKDENLKNTYKTLMGSMDVASAIEEFLIADRKKSAVALSIQEHCKEFGVLEENTMEQLVITRNSWGYAIIFIDSDVEFIELDATGTNRTVITGDDFTGNKYILEYVVNKEKLHKGLNLGRISIRNGSQCLSYEVTVHNAGMGKANLEERSALSNLTCEYLKYRMRKETMTEWMESSNQILDRIRGIDNDNVFYKLAQAQVFIAQGRSEDAEWLLESSREMVLENKSTQVELYCYYLYVSSLARKDAEYTKEAVSIVKKYFDNGHDSWRILWILFYLDADQDKNKSIKLARLKDMYHKGCTSPVMYYEALTILNSVPVLLRVLNEFELQVIRFGCRHDVINEDLADYISDLVAEEKVAGMECLDILMSLNERFDKDGILNVLVTHMVRNELSDPKYFPIYEKGILRGLRITRLYEFYMASLDKNQMKRLPKIVLMYFAYESMLEYSIKAYLLANIIVNEPNNTEVMSAYEAQIERFAYDQMGLRHIDANLAVIYRHVFKNGIVTGDSAEFISRFLFTYKVTCHDEKCAYVVVKHREIAEPVKYRVVNGVAYVQMYTENCTIVFENEAGIRFKDSVRYELERLYDNSAMLEEIVTKHNQDLYIRIYIYRKNVYNKVHSSTALENCQQLLSCEYLDPQFRGEVEHRIIDYVHDHYTGNDFRTRYTGITKTGLTIQDGQRLAEICILNEMYEDAFDLVKMYGYMNMPAIKVFKLARHIIEIHDNEEDELITQMCRRVFESKKYDEGILEYMERYYNDSNIKMYIVWRACENFSVENQNMGERLVSQMLFTGEISANSQEVFRSYYKGGARPELIRGYIAYHSYMYFVRQARSDNTIYDIVEKYVDEKNVIPDVCKLALLLNYSEEQVIGELSDYQINMAQQILDEMCAASKFFGFYKRLQGVLAFPYNMVDKTVLEFRTNPEQKVDIHYSCNGSEYITENMRSSVAGVFTKAFTMFYGDNIQYYLTYEKDGELCKSEEFSCICNNLGSQTVEGRFDNINEMLASMELHDMATLKKLMYGYGVQNYVAAQIFKPM